MSKIIMVLIPILTPKTKQQYEQDYDGIDDDFSWNLRMIHSVQVVGEGKIFIYLVFDKTLT